MATCLGGVCVRADGAVCVCYPFCVDVCTHLCVCLEGADACGLYTRGGGVTGAKCAHTCVCARPCPHGRRQLGLGEPPEPRGPGSPGASIPVISRPLLHFPGTASPVLAAGDSRARPFPGTAFPLGSSARAWGLGGAERQEWDHTFPDLRVVSPRTVIENKGVARPFPV